MANWRTRRGTSGRSIDPSATDRTVLHRLGDAPRRTRRRPSCNGRTILRMNRTTAWCSPTTNPDAMTCSKCLVSAPDRVTSTSRDMDRCIDAAKIFYARNSWCVHIGADHSLSPPNCLLRPSQPCRNHGAIARPRRRSPARSFRSRPRSSTQTPAESSRQALQTAPAMVMRVCLRHRDVNTSDTGRPGTLTLNLAASRSLTTTVAGSTARICGDDLETEAIPCARRHAVVYSRSGDDHHRGAHR
jgi:hypothetical protein